MWKLGSRLIQAGAVVDPLYEIGARTDQAEGNGGFIARRAHVANATPCVFVDRRRRAARHWHRIDDDIVARALQWPQRIHDLLADGAVGVALDSRARGLCAEDDRFAVVAPDRFVEVRR